MSLKINNISTNSSINSIKDNKIISFKNNPIMHDKIEVSSNKELSTSAKAGIGIGIVSLIGLGFELTIGKGKHLKSLWEKINGKKPTTGTNSLPHIPDFNNINEAKEYFEKIGVKTVFKDGSEKHLADLNNIKNDLVLLEKNGVALPKPESVVVSDWHNIEELKQIFRHLNISEEQASVCNKNSGYWGTVEKGNDNKNHVLINSSFNGDYGAFIHEMGHIHQDHLNSSYWHSKGLNSKEFMQKQMEVLGLSDIHLDSKFDTPKKFISSILRYHNLPNNLPVKTKEKIYRMFPNINDDDFIKIFAIPDINGKTYYINAKKMVDKMASESHVYAPTKTWENVAEIFQGLNKGEEYSDLIMLMYDINGGGRVPNLVIKGKKYDDYIESLYNNSDLIRQLRECIEVKELI